jgi:hypothetical protein
MARKPQPELIARQWELVRRLPPPRRVRSRWGTRFLYGLLIVLFVVAPACTVGFMAEEYFEREDLRSRGISTTGRIVGVDVGDTESTSTRVDYEFEVDGKTHRFNVAFGGDHYLAKGSTEVIYLSEDPGQATSRYYLSMPFFDTSAGMVMIFGACLPWFGVPFGWFLTRSFRRHGRLLVRGMPAVATVDAVVHVKDDERRVDYAFQAGGALRRGSVVVEGLAAEKTQPGQRLAMLYDPADSKRTDLFFAAVASYVIVEPAASRAAAPVGN